MTRNYQCRQLSPTECHITGLDTHPAVIVSRAAGTTVPLGIDDVRSAKKAETISVQFFNGLLITQAKVVTKAMHFSDNYLQFDILQ